MNYTWIRFLAIGLLTACVGSELAAQGFTPAWTRRLSPAHWTQIAQLSTNQIAKKTLYLLPLERQLPAILKVKTTPENLIKHKVFYSGLFSRVEKDILLKPVYPQATLGKIAYVHDKHAVYFEKMSIWNVQHIDQTAFTRHQEILRNLLGTFQAYYIETEPEKFTSDVFSKEEILRLNENPSQPAAYMLSTKQLQDFATLPTLQEQKYWVQRQIIWEEEIAHSLLLQDITSLSATQFEQYYRSQLRISYFRLLEKVLAHATTKRSSAIVRYKRSIPGQKILMTDAQRGGYLQLKKDTNNDPSVDDLIMQFNEAYAPYAAAEALGAPYEIALKYGSVAPELLGTEEGTRLRKLKPHACLEELTPKIHKLEDQLSTLQKNPSDTPEFYGTYYRLYAQKQIYQALTARAKFSIHHFHE